MDTANAKQVASMPKFVNVLRKKLGMSGSTMNHVCTSSDPEGKPDVDALLKFFDSLASDSRKTVSVPDPVFWIVAAKVVLADIGMDGAELEAELKQETDKLRGEMAALKRANELANERASGPIGQFFGGVGDLIDGVGGVVLGGGPLVSTFTKLFWYPSVQDVQTKDQDSLSCRCDFAGLSASYVGAPPVF
jgi:hypothetical protein